MQETLALGSSGDSEGTVSDRGAACARLDHASRIADRLCRRSLLREAGCSKKHTASDKHLCVESK